MRELARTDILRFKGRAYDYPRDPVAERRHQGIVLMPDDIEELKAELRCVRKQLDELRQWRVAEDVRQDQMRANQVSMMSKIDSLVSLVSGIKGARWVILVIVGALGLLNFSAIKEFMLGWLHPPH